MEERKVTKTATLIISAIIIILQLFYSPNWEYVGIYTDCKLIGRFLYPFFHANLIHCCLNIWCLLSIIFIYDVSFFRLIVAYIIAITFPINIFGQFLDNMNIPTVGLSAVVFFLFGSISFEVSRKWYYQSWMVFYIILGFVFPKTNGWLHLYAYVLGLFFALLNKPIKPFNYDK